MEEKKDIEQIKDELKAADNGLSDEVIEKAAEGIEDMTEEELQREANKLKAIKLLMNNELLTMAFIGVIQRAEQVARMTGENQYVVNIDNGVAFFPEEKFKELSDQAVEGFKKYLLEQDSNISEEEIEKNCEIYRLTLILHKIDASIFEEKEAEAEAEAEADKE